MRLITRKSSTVGVELPSSPLDPKCKACPAYHIKGMCNTGMYGVIPHVPATRVAYTFYVLGGAYLALRV